MKLKWSCSDMSFLMRRPAFCICENKGGDQLHGNRAAVWNFKPLANFCVCTAWFVLDLVRNLKDRVSRNAAHMSLGKDAYWLSAYECEHATKVNSLRSQFDIMLLNETKSHKVYNMLSLVMRNSAFCIWENKDADQLHSNCAADQRPLFSLDG